jgi:hypothetical protein
VLITATIESFEGGVAVVDVPGALLSADVDEEVITTIRGRLAELMVKTAPKICRKYITLNANNKPVVCVKLQKATYGCLRSALLFYLKLAQDLESKDFEINPYDQCVANKMIYGKQFSVTWHVDDLKLSHMGGGEVTNMIVWMESIYGEICVSRGKIHENLGIAFGF